MKEWQIHRLLNVRTECNMDELSDRSPPTGPARFFATCRNITFYPDGVVVECPDRTDEWTCKILTEARSFKNLDMLHQER